MRRAGLPLRWLCLHRGIIAFLAGAKTADFATVRDATKTTDGKASIHLRKLEDAGYVAMQKRFVARKPQTLYSLTELGRRALLAYVAHLEALLPPSRGETPPKDATR